MSSNSTICNPEDLVNREAKGLEEDANFGEVQKVGVAYIVTKNGILDKDKFDIPKNLTERFEDGLVYFGFTKVEAKQYTRAGEEPDIVF